MSVRGLTAIVAVAAVLATPASAHADGDPASDVLLRQDVFFPYAPPTSNGVARALLELTRRTRADGWPIKVAIIASDQDLGAWGALFSDPQRYADVLAQELRNPRLLVVMPFGFGGQRLGAGVNRALAGLPPVQGGGDALARQAMTAVARLAAEDGHRVAVPAVDASTLGRRPYRESAQLHTRAQAPAATSAVSSPATGKNGTPAWLYVAPVALVVAFLLALTLRDRLGRGPTEYRPPPSGSDT